MTEEQLLIWAEAYTAGHDEGYRARVAEENGAYPPEPVLVLGRWWDQAAERQQHDAETRRLLAEERAE